MRRQHGFTMIELMIVVAIIAILSAIALPAYRRYVVRSHRTDAQRALMDLAGRQERYLYSNNAYTNSLASLGAAGSLGGTYYTVSIDPAATSTVAYSVVATAVGTQQQDDPKCQALALDQAGRRSSTGSITNYSACWGQ